MLLDRWKKEKLKRESGANDVHVSYLKNDQKRDFLATERVFLQISERSRFCQNFKRRFFALEQIRSASLNQEKLSGDDFLTRFAEKSGNLAKKENGKKL